MKNPINKILCIFFFMCLLFAFHGCIERENHIPLPPDGKTYDDQFMDLGNLNYNTGYGSIPDGEKGYLLYDDIDFNSVIFSSNLIVVDSVEFSVFYGGELQAKSTKGLDNRFKKYRLDQKGEYSFEVTAQKRDGTTATDSFKVKVASKGRPDNIKFTIKNSNGDIVEKAKGGDNYTVSATILSDGKEISLNEGDYFWEKPENIGVVEYTFSLGNQVRENTKKFDFYCFVNNNSGDRFNICDSYYTITDNLVKCEAFPEGIYYDYGVQTNNGNIDLDVNVGSEDYFYNKITAEYRFDNGEVVELERSDRIDGGKFSMLISYDNSDFSIYSLSKHNYNFDSRGNRLVNYYDNGVHYQFNPDKTSAKVILAVWHNVKTNYGFTSYGVNIGSSELVVDINSKAPEVFKIASISGSHKDDSAAFRNSYKQFNKPLSSVNDDTIELYVCCDMDGNGIITDEYRRKSLEESKQYFLINVEVGEGNLLDYTIEYTYDANSSIELVCFEKPVSGYLDRFYVCPNLGITTITVKSRFSDKESKVKIKVIDKVFDESRVIDNDSVNAYSVFSTVDFSSFVKIKEYRLSSHNSNNFYYRSLRSDEELEYSKDDATEITAPNAFSYLENGGEEQTITVRIKNSNIKRKIFNVYIIPKFDFVINDNLFSIETIENTAFFSKSVTSLPHNNDKVFQGLIPVLDYQATDDDYSFSIVGGGELENITIGGDDTIPRWSHNKIDNVITVYYLFSNRNYRYKVEILKINVKY